jgi:hypothetical protein
MTLLKLYLLFICSIILSKLEFTNSEPETKSTVNSLVFLNKLTPSTFKFDIFTSPKIYSGENFKKCFFFQYLLPPFMKFTLLKYYHNEEINER